MAMRPCIPGMVIVRFALTKTEFVLISLVYLMVFTDARNVFPVKSYTKTTCPIAFQYS